MGQDLVRKGEGGKKLSNDPVYFVVEGFLLFYDRAVNDLLDIRIWMDADMETCVYRRHYRSQKKQDTDIEKTRRWFDGQVWPAYKKNRRTQLDNARDAVHLDAALDKWEIHQQAVDYCEDQLPLVARGQNERPRTPDRRMPQTLERRATRRPSPERSRGTNKCQNDSRRGNETCRRRNSRSFSREGATMRSRAQNIVRQISAERSGPTRHRRK